MEIIEIANCLFKDRHRWKEVTDNDKEKWIFIFNRYTSKKYPEFSQLLNQKGINKILAFDLLFEFFKDKPYPKWFWSKSTKESKDIGDVKESDIKILKEKYEIDDKNLRILLKYFKEDVLEDLKWYKKLDKDK